MSEAIGPGTELMCIRSCHCCGCGEGVNAGARYVCTGVHEMTLLDVILFGPCSCEIGVHPFLHINDKQHAFCPTIFVPLGKLDAVKETNEPLEVKRKPQWGEGPAMPITRRVKEDQDA